MVGEKKDLIRNTYIKVKTLFKIYFFWSKKDRIRAIEIRERYQLPAGTWIKDEKQINLLNMFILEDMWEMATLQQK